MNLLDNSEKTGLAEMTAEIAAAYVSNNNVVRADLATLIASIHNSLSLLGAPQAQPELVPLVPAVPVKKSITPDYIICLDDGKKFKSLKRHLTQLGLTPEEYRIKWGLPNDYPMVAATYAAKRSQLALSTGLGRRKAEQVREPARKTSRGRRAD